MADNSVLAYLDLICGTKYATKNSFFSDKKYFTEQKRITTPLLCDGVRASSSSSNNFDDFELIRVQSSDNSLPAAPSPQLPIHSILRDIQKLAHARTDEELQHAAEFFTPLVLHHWQLSRLLNVVRCNNPILKRLDKQRKNIAKKRELQLAIAKHTYLFDTTVASHRAEINRLNAENERINAELEKEKRTRKLETSEGLQAALLLATLLNVVFREGMSTPWQSERVSLEKQQKEYRGLLSSYYDIEFDDEFDPVFAQHEPTIKRDDVVFVTDIQGWFTTLNPARLAVQRSRRLSVFLDPVLQNFDYSAFIRHIDPYTRKTLAYVNWVFFVPRLMLNASILYHHVFNDAELNHLEKKLDRVTRFRAHWTRLWWEVQNDIPWFINGIIICFFLVGGAMSPTGLCLSVVMQLCDLLGAVTRATIELCRLTTMMSDLEKVNASPSLKKDLMQRVAFERLVFAYQIFHFSVLMTSLYLTLPSMAAISLMWPVVGGVSAVLMTGLTFLVTNYLNDIRQKEYEPRPESPHALQPATSRVGMV